MKKIPLILLFFALAFGLKARETSWTLASPDGRLVAHIAADDLGLGLTYDVKYNGEQHFLVGSG